MRFDIFFSICQTPVDGYQPNEATMFANFFDQVRLADELGFGCAWVAETHLSCQVQKQNANPVIPHFEGEIGLNTDILQLATHIFYQTKQIRVGSAIRNILCNGGPIAHAESVKSFLSLNSQMHPDRILEIGFASGRFPFSNRPYGIYPRDEFEKAYWPLVQSKLFLEATEIFLRLLKGDVLSSASVQRHELTATDFKSQEDWLAAIALYKETYLNESKSEETSVKNQESYFLKPRWNFERLGVIPNEASLKNLRLTIGAHSSEAHIFANQFLPVGVFNLSITPAKQIESVHQTMLKHFHPDGGPWTRSHMPRTVLVFINDDQGISDAEKRERANKAAQKSLTTYWKAMEGTIDPQKVANAVDNALVGTPNDICDQLNVRYHPDDRLMLWFDFNNHANEDVKKQMKLFMDQVASRM